MNYLVSPCLSCVHKKGIPGDVHVFCGLAFDRESNPLDAVMQILGSVGRVPLPGPNKQIDWTPKLKNWPGCGSWPSLYDTNIVVKCPKQKSKEKL